jgi:hypothetical protein
MEYSDSKNAIIIKNLLLFKEHTEILLILKSIRIIKGVQNIKLYEGINLIKKSLQDWRTIDYYIIGGKQFKILEL